MRIDRFGLQEISWGRRVAYAIPALLVFWQITSLIIWKPLKGRLEDSRRIAERRLDLQRAVSFGRDSLASLEAAHARCVSGDPATVAHRYQEWLSLRTESIGKVAVSAGNPLAEGSLGWHVPLNIEGDCPLAKLSDLLTDITSLPLLHRITYLQIDPVSKDRDSEESVHFSMNLVAIAISGAPTMSEFPPSAPDRDRSFNEYLAARKPFSRRESGVALTAKKPKVDAAPKRDDSPKQPSGPGDPLKGLVLVASVVVDGKPQVWVADAGSKREFVLHVGDSLSSLGGEGRLVRIRDDDAEVALKSGAITWSMGTSLRDALDRPRGETTGSAPSAQ